jgi:magnesium transporter
MRASLMTEQQLTRLDSLEDIGQVYDGHGFAWLDIEEAVQTQGELARVAEPLGMDVTHLSKVRPHAQVARYELEDNVAEFVLPIAQDGDVVWARAVGTADRLITSHAGPLGIVDDVRAELGTTTARRVDTALYLFAEAALLSFRDALRPIRDLLDDLEDGLMTGPGTRDVSAVGQVRRQLRRLRQAVVSYGLAVHSFESRLPFRDDVSRDHQAVVRALARGVDALEQSIESLAQDTSHLMDLYHSVVATRQGQVVNRLTLVSIIFLPLTFLTGFFGMNFGYLVDSIAPPSMFWLLGVGLMLVALAVVIGIIIRNHWQDTFVKWDQDLDSDRRAAALPGEPHGS